MGIYGIKQPKSSTQTVENIQRYSDKYKVPKENSFVIDTSYTTFIAQIDTTKKDLQRNHFQPLQALYFNKTGRLVSYHVNCYAGGFPNLKWNRDGILEAFVPKTQAPLDTLLTFSKQLEFIRTMDGKTLSAKQFDTFDYNVIVYWSIFMGRQSKHLIKEIKENCKFANDKKVRLMFVNIDNAFIRMAYNE
jgi:hypothetical protein